MSRDLVLLFTLCGLACAGGEETGSSYTENELDWIRAGGAPESRTEAVDCDDFRNPGATWDADEDGAPDDGKFQEVDCLSDADCTGGTNGRCESDPAGYALFCSYDECLADSDCSHGSICACGGDDTRNDCVPSTCSVDADCNSGALCVQDSFVCHTGGYHCMAPDAECIRDEDCPDDMSGTTDPPDMGDCTYNTSNSAWECGFNNCGD